MLLWRRCQDLDTHGHGAFLAGAHMLKHALSRFKPVEIGALLRPDADEHISAAIEWHAETITLINREKFDLAVEDDFLLVGRRHVVGYGRVIDLADARDLRPPWSLCEVTDERRALA